MQHRIPVWDLPICIFHWLLAILVCAAIATALVGGNAMVLHGRLGIAVCGLLGFRIVWGVVGTRTARFTHFVRGPGAIRDYLQGRWQGIGHNPLGALSVLALLGAVGFQAVGGLFSNDDIAFSGPLRTLVDKATSDRITGIHRDMFGWLVALLVLHVGAILYYRVVRGEDLLGPMVRGWTYTGQPEAENTTVKGLSWVIAIAAGLGCALLASGVWLPEPVPVAVPVTPDW